MLKIAWSPAYHHPLPEGHRFPMSKYSVLPEQLLYEGTVAEANFFAPQALTEAQVLRTHHTAYWHRLKTGTLSQQEIRRIGFPYDAALVARELIICSGTTQNALFALEFGCSMNIAGGTHHAYTNRGEGFCLLNDIAIAANHVLDQGLAKQVLVVDLDVHQGNGTAQIFADEPRVFTFSMHGAGNYPLHKEKSDIDVPLPDGIGDAEYLLLLQHHLPRLIDAVQPDFIFYQAGVDVLKTDKLGRLGLSISGCKQRDRFVFETCKTNGIPVAVSMGGGYSEKLADIIEAHANTYREAQRIFF
jgi:acetoin utilization deacetylase AcuC-like enzyme